LLDDYRNLLMDIYPSMIQGGPIDNVTANDSFDIAEQVLMTEEKRLELLQENSLKKRFEAISELLHKEIETLKFLLADHELEVSTHQLN